MVLGFIILMQSVEWKHTSSPVTKRFRIQESAGKVIFRVFWDVQGAAYTKQRMIIRITYGKGQASNEQWVDSSHFSTNTIPPSIKQAGRSYLFPPPFPRHPSPAPLPFQNTPELVLSVFHSYGPLNEASRGKRSWTTRISIIYCNDYIKLVNRCDNASMLMGITSESKRSLIL